MRCSLVIPSVILLASAACADRDAAKPAAVDSEVAEHSVGEIRTTIAPHDEHPAVGRSGPRVPIVLPDGFTLYPGAEVVTNTVIERGGHQRTLLVFETNDPVSDVIAFYRRQGAAAGAQFSLDVGGERRASLGGTLARGRAFAASARRNARTRVELAFE